MLLQTKINTEYSNVQRTYVNLRTVQLLANLTPALIATEQRYNATQVLKSSFYHHNLRSSIIPSSLSSVTIIIIITIKIIIIAIIIIDYQHHHHHH